MTPYTPIDINRYRKVGWKFRVLALLGYIVITLFCFPPFRGEFLYQIGLFLAIWTLCFNPKTKTPAFIRFHLLQGIAYTTVLLLVPTVFSVLIGFLGAVLAFIPTVNLEGITHTALSYIAFATLLLLGGLLLFNAVMVLLGKQHELPLIGKWATRLTY
jgi:hypothetical protein